MSVSLTVTLGLVASPVSTLLARALLGADEHQAILTAVGHFVTDVEDVAIPACTGWHSRIWAVVRCGEALHHVASAFNVTQKRPLSQDTIKSTPQNTLTINMFSSFFGEKKCWLLFEK